MEGAWWADLPSEGSGIQQLNETKKETNEKSNQVPMQNNSLSICGRTDQVNPCVMSIVELRRNTMLPKPHETWRMCNKPCTGQIIGLNTFRGLTLATNGIMVAIQTSANTLLFGHLEWFIKDKPEQETDVFDHSSAKHTSLDVLDEFLELT